MRWNVSLAALASSWGLISVIGAYVSVDAAALAAARVVLGSAAILAALAAVRRVRTLAVPRDRRLLLAASGVVLAGHWGLWFETVKLSSVAVALVTIYTAPLYLAVLAPLLLGERRSRTALVALAPALAGICLIAGAADGGGAHVRLAAIACGVGSGVLYALLIVTTKQLTRTLPSVTVQFWQCVAAAAALAGPVALGGRVVPQGVEIPLVAVLGVVYTGGGYFLFVALTARVKAQAAGILMYLEPVSAALLAWLLLGQPLSPQVVAGGALVVAAGVAVIVLEPPAAPEPPRPRPAPTHVPAALPTRAR